MRSHEQPRHAVRTIVTALVLTLFSATFLFAQHGKVRAEVNLPYNSVLPGIPFDVTVRLTNTTQQPVSVGTVATISVVLPDGTTVTPEAATLLQPTTTPAASWVDLGPGATAEVGTSWLYGGGIGWSTAHKFSSPGTYEIALTLRTSGEEPAAYVGPIRTNTALMERLTPEGIDAELWRRMSRIGRNQWTDDGFLRFREGQDLAAEIVDAHPSSGYYPYALLLRTRQQG